LIRYKVRNKKFSSFGRAKKWKFWAWWQVKKGSKFSPEHILKKGKNQKFSGWKIGKIWANHTWIKGENLSIFALRLRAKRQKFFTWKPGIRKRS
jgi:hypothetical protein